MKEGQRPFTKMLCETVADMLCTQGLEKEVATWLLSRYQRVKEEESGYFDQKKYSELLVITG